MTQIVIGNPSDGDDEDKHDLIDKLLSDQFSNPDLSTFSAAILSEFGGMNGLARELRIEYEQLKPGSTGRTYILRSVVELVKAAVLKKGSVNPLEGVSMEEMKAAIKKLSKEHEQGGE